MSTRSVVGKGTIDSFTGIYVHWNGYPTCNGETLYRTVRDQFGGDPAPLLDILLAHTSGWSDITDKDWSQKPGFIGMDGRTKASKLFDHQRQARGAFYSVIKEFDGPRTPNAPGFDPGTEITVGLEAYRSGCEFLAHEWPVLRRPACYCHGDRHDWEDWTLGPQDMTGETGLEWAYLFDTERPLMRIYAISGHGNAAPFLVAGVDLAGPEPDWQAIEDVGRAWKKLQYEQSKAKRVA